MTALRVVPNRPAICAVESPAPSSLRSCLSLSAVQKDVLIGKTVRRDICDGLVIRVRMSRRRPRECDDEPRLGEPGPWISAPRHRRRLRQKSLVIGVERKTYQHAVPAALIKGMMKRRVCFRERTGKLALALSVTGLTRSGPSATEGVVLCAHNPDVICYPEISLSCGLGGPMRRRDFITLLGGAAVAAFPLPLLAQQAGRTVRVGMLETVSTALKPDDLAAFKESLRALGYVERQNLRIEYRSADGRPERFPELAQELVTLNVDVITTRGTPAAFAARNATSTIPIVMAAIGEPLLVVASLARPVGNITGLSAFVTDLMAKRVELLRD
jgi:hypothetical protein